MRSLCRVFLIMKTQVSCEVNLLGFCFPLSPFPIGKSDIACWLGCSRLKYFSLLPGLYLFWSAYFFLTYTVNSLKLGTWIPYPAAWGAGPSRHVFKKDTGFSAFLRQDRIKRHPQVYRGNNSAYQNLCAGLFTETSGSDTFRGETL